jgi:hypothetical protein
MWVGSGSWDVIDKECVSWMMSWWCRPWCERVWCVTHVTVTDDLWMSVCWLMWLKEIMRGLCDDVLDIEKIVTLTLTLSPSGKHLFLYQEQQAIFSGCTNILVCWFGCVDQAMVVPWALSLLNPFGVMGATLCASLIAYLYAPEMWSWALCSTSSSGGLLHPWIVLEM